MIREDIVDRLMKESVCYGISRKEMRKVVRTVFATMADALGSGEEIIIREFGRFLMKLKKPRLINHPETKEKVWSRAKLHIQFHPCPEIKEKLFLEEEDQSNPTHNSGGATI